MLSEIIKNVALLLDDQEVLNYLQATEVQEDTPTNVNTYITLVNFVLTNIAQNFLCYKCTEELVSDSNCKLNLADLSHGICTIKSVKDQNLKQVKFSTSIDYIFTQKPNKLHYVEYTFLPSNLTSLDDTVLLPLGLDIKTVCYGVVCEFYTLKMQFTEANIWEQKFKANLKNLNKRYIGIRFASKGLLWKNQ